MNLLRLYSSGDSTMKRSIATHLPKCVIQSVFYSWMFVLFTKYRNIVQHAPLAVECIGYCEPVRVISLQLINAEGENVEKIHRCSLKAHAIQSLTFNTTSMNKVLTSVP